MSTARMGSNNLKSTDSVADHLRLQMVTPQVLFDLGVPISDIVLFRNFPGCGFVLS